MYHRRDGVTKTTYSAAAIICDASAMQYIYMVNFCGLDRSLLQNKYRNFLQVFNFANFVNFQPFAKTFQLNLQKSLFANIQTLKNLALYGMVSAAVCLGCNNISYLEISLSHAEYSCTKHIVGCVFTAYTTGDHNRETDKHQFFQWLLSWLLHK